MTFFSLGWYFQKQKADTGIPVSHYSFTTELYILSAAHLSVLHALHTLNILQELYSILEVSGCFIIL